MDLKGASLIYYDSHSGRSIKKYQSQSTQTQQNLTYKNINKPLNSNTNQIAFKGFKFLQKAKDFALHSEQKTAGTLLEKVTTYVAPEKHSGISSLKNLINEKNLQNESVYVIKPLGKSFVEAVLTLPKMIGNGVKKLTGSETTSSSSTQKNLNQLLGYFNEINVHERAFNRVFEDQLPKLRTILEKNNPKELTAFFAKNRLNTRHLVRKDADDFANLKNNLLKDKPEEFIANLRSDYIYNSIRNKEASRRGSYIPNVSNENLQFVNRTASGLIGGGFVANDFYNLHMLASNDKEGAKKERNKRFAQQAACVGISAYLGYIVFATFKRISNKSLSAATGLGFATLIGANIASRKLLGIPLFPQKSKDTEQKPYILQASTLKNAYASKLNLDNKLTLDNQISADYKNSRTYQQFKKSSSPKSLSFGSWRGLTGIKNQFNKRMLAKMPYEKFEESYKIYEKTEPEIAKELLQITRKFMKHIDGVPQSKNNIKLSDIKKAAEANNNEVFTGKNTVYRAGRSLMDAVTFPFEVLKELGRHTANLGLKIVGKPAIPKQHKDRYNHEIAVKNLVKWSERAKDKAGYTGKAENMPENKLLKVKNYIGQKINESHGPDVMEYGNDQLSTAMKFTGFAAVPFLAVDAYNTSLKETKNKNISVEKAKHRTLQDTTRQGISYWTIRSFNDIFKGLANHSLAGAAAAATINTAIFEAATRKLVGQPLTPKSHEEMRKIEKERLQNQGFLSNVFGGKVKAEKDKIIIGCKKLRSLPVKDDNSNFAFKNFENKLASVKNY